MLHELRKKVIMHAHGGQLAQEAQVTVPRLGRSTRSMIRRGWLPLSVLVASVDAVGRRISVPGTWTHPPWHPVNRPPRAVHVGPPVPLCMNIGRLKINQPKSLPF
jgi:hypothetical protein